MSERYECSHRGSAVFRLANVRTRDTVVCGTRTLELDRALAHPNGLANQPLTREFSAVQRHRDSIGPRTKRSSIASVSDQFRSESELGSPLDLRSLNQFEAFSSVSGTPGSALTSPSADTPASGKPSANAFHYEDGKSYATLTQFYYTSPSTSSCVTESLTTTLCDIPASSPLNGISAFTSFAGPSSVDSHRLYSYTPELSATSVPSVVGSPPS